MAVNTKQWYSEGIMLDQLRRCWPSLIHHGAIVSCLLKCHGFSVTELYTASGNNALYKHAVTMVKTYM